MHQLKIECREQGCGSVVHLTVADLSDEKEVSLPEAQYYVDHRVPARCGTCFGNNWGAYEVRHIEVKPQREWASVS